ncbi:hypothetical protein J2P12_05490 [Candidatus Bathyarchaeota archaeon]|nr:hypothetical protein [Candidatus Bathyarchaeota archaeon]
MAISSIMFVAYASAGIAYASSTKTTWSSNPLTLTFAASDGSGSASDSVSCNQNLSDLSLRISVSDPTRMSLTSSPVGLSCSGSATTVTFTAHCIASADACRGTYHGLVQLRQNSGYRNFPANLKIVITVT